MRWCQLSHRAGAPHTRARGRVKVVAHRTRGVDRLTDTALRASLRRQFPYAAHCGYECTAPVPVLAIVAATLGLVIPRVASAPRSCPQFTPDALCSRQRHAILRSSSAAMWKGWVMCRGVWRRLPRPHDSVRIVRKHGVNTTSVLTRFGHFSLNCFRPKWRLCYKEVLSRCFTKPSILKLRVHTADWSTAS